MPQTAKMAPPAPANGAAALLAVSKAASLRIVDGVRTPPHGRVARQSPPYSSEMQQPVRATAALGKHPRTRQAASSDREQHRAGSLHPDGLTALAAFWPPKDAQRCLLRISEWHFARLGKNELVADANADLYGSDGLGMIDPIRHHGSDIVRAVADEWGIDGARLCVLNALDAGRLQDEARMMIFRNAVNNFGIRIGGGVGMFLASEG